jgi:hypothetical protein
MNNSNETFNIETIAITLSNDEYSTDNEIIGFLVSETGFNKETISAIVNKERDNFLGSTYTNETNGFNAIKTYLK